MIDAGGAVRMHLEFRTDDFDELYAGDAVPAPDSGWLVAETAR